MTTLKLESLDRSPTVASNICVAEVIWPKFIEPNHVDRQLRELTTLSESARTGIILDCSLIEVANSEVVNLLMRVRNHAKKRNREIALFNVPDALRETLRLCNLHNVLRSTNDAPTAKKLVQNMARGKGSARLWVESHKAMAALITFGLCGMMGLTMYLING